MGYVRLNVRKCNNDGWKEYEFRFSRIARSAQQISFESGGLTPIRYKFFTIAGRISPLLPITDRSTTELIGVGSRFISMIFALLFFAIWGIAAAGQTTFEVPQISATSAVLKNSREVCQIF